ncbi:MAG: hypothetical protein JW760_05600 [Spirochaetales bacterium]|nr:hypothetical protein [Spirochaetales bacterium]
MPKELKGPSNAEIKKLLDQAMVRLQNWRREMEVNPNPRMVHSFKNVMAIIESLTRTSRENTYYSYKDLSRKMALLINDVAALNIAITESLETDDYIDVEEEKLIIQSLMGVMQSAADLMVSVQEGFGMQGRIPLEFKTPVLEEQ